MLTVEKAVIGLKLMQARKIKTDLQWVFKQLGNESKIVKELDGFVSNS